jgi:hypothetical protein
MAERIRVRIVADLVVDSTSALGAAAKGLVVTPDQRGRYLKPLVKECSTSDAQNRIDVISVKRLR